MSTLPHIAQEVTVNQRHDSAIQNLMAAANFARAVGRLEIEHKDKSYGAFFDEIRWNVSAAIIMSIAALEANLNELLDDLHADKEFLELIERRTFWDRHQFSLWHFGKARFDMGAAPAQPIGTLLELRNELVHAKPEWDNQQNRHAKLGKKIATAFQLSPFFAATEPVYPLRAMSYGCASWAVTSACALGEEMALRLKGKPKFAQFSAHLNTAH